MPMVCHADSPAPTASVPKMMPKGMAPTISGRISRQPCKNSCERDIGAPWVHNGTGYMPLSRCSVRNIEDGSMTRDESPAKTANLTRCWQPRRRVAWRYQAIATRLGQKRSDDAAPGHHGTNQSFVPP